MLQINKQFALMTFLAIAFLVNRWFFQGARGLTGVASRLLNHATDFYG
eukprot:CAMPEP_0168796330 /NCGR_PEP_ID=MMETSP0725-20121227/16691_1 /TAXON_ID=265536 /ORGANISM="Amphiprora sp., Strain CCMP467" /LENGTH=47 /DNA_ID= /DNA_START= /DNA_END= /DNA_ORIENTATION=